jgi:hypothetical protein
MRRLANSVKPRHGNPLPIERRKGTASAALANAALRPTIQAALTINAYGKDFADLELAALVEQLEARAREVNGGNLQRAEAVLMSQATTLDSVFNTLARRACSPRITLEMYQHCMRFALRAQSQCCRTLEVLAAIKNPPIVIARQANIAAGPQQVNNGPHQTTRHATRAGEKENEQNKLLEHQDGERMDARAQGAAGNADTDMEAVGKGHRSEDGRRKTAR